MAKTKEVTSEKGKRVAWNKKYEGKVGRPGIRVPMDLYEDLKICLIKNGKTIQDITLEFYELYVETQKAKMVNGDANKE